MNILICNLGIGGGGAERVLIDFIQYWNTQQTLINPKTNIDLFLIEKKKQDAYLPFVQEHLHQVFTFPHIFGKVRFLNKFWKRRVLNNPALINHFITKTYDVVIGFLEGISSIYISQLKSGKKISYIHTSLYEIRNGIRDEKEAKAYMAMDCIICVSHYAKDSLLRLYPELESKRIEVIYNPLNKNMLLQKAQEKIEISKEKFVFLQVGRLTYQKGLATFLKAHKILQDKGVGGYEIWLLGEGKRYKNELDLFIKTNGLKNIKFLGFVKNPYPYIKACDCKILSSHFEGCPMVLLESAALGKAIISSDIPTSKEILSSSALYFKNQDAKDLSECMQKILCDSELRNNLQSQALKQSEQFDLTKSAKALETILYDLAMS